MFLYRNIALVRGNKILDLTVDPVPDLVIEIDISNISPNRLQVYTDLGVAENWIYDGESLTVDQLQNGAYSRYQTSQFFPSILISEIAEFVQQAPLMDYLELVKTFRSWVRSQIHK